MSVELRSADPVTPTVDDAVVVRGLTKSYGRDEVLHGLDFRIRPGQVVGLLGPSGSGKSTLLRCLAGLEPIDGGELWLDGTLASGHGVHLPPERRPIGMVFQSYALWPHMSVHGNIEFPMLRDKPKPSRAERDQRVTDVLAALGLEELDERLPGQLSGGQQQRVAVARALVRRPQLMLLDEPLSNLDARLRRRVRAELKLLFGRIKATTVYVTHDQSEALALCDRVLVMRDGRIVQDGTPQALYEEPSDRFVAEFVGESNLLTMTTGARAGAVSFGVAGQELVVPADRVALAPGTRLGEEHPVLLRPSLLELAAPAPGDTDCLSGVLEAVSYLGDHLECLVRVGSHELLVNAAPGTAPAAGTPVAVRVLAARVLP
jgi:iron(III) transport system ATP-binding protein